MTLTGLKSDYVSDGRPISQILDRQATPPAIAANEQLYDDLSSAYKQLNAPFGEFGQDALNISTKAVTEPNSEYQAWDAQLNGCQSLRQPVATQIDEMLNGASFAGRFDAFTASSELSLAQALLSDIQELKSSSTPPSHGLCSTTPPPQGAGGGLGRLLGLLGLLHL
ncbi:MAG TPA: hypothetical protein VHX88_08995 [Solirubrobacteraceae bacterium]|jgi:hypothetical protein|nr:hypothetical protein [Solirubrobacteraceae bacterium]